MFSSSILAASMITYSVTYFESFKSRHLVRVVLCTSCLHFVRVSHKLDPRLRPAERYHTIPVVGIGTLVYPGEHGPQIDNLRLA